MFKIIKEDETNKKEVVDLYWIINKFMYVLKFINKMESISKIDSEIIITQIKKILQAIDDTEEAIVNSLSTDIKDKINNLAENKLLKTEKLYIRCFDNVIPDERLVEILNRLESTIKTCKEENIDYNTLFGIETDIIVIENCINNIEKSIDYALDENTDC